MRIYAFERLDVWRESRHLVKWIYEKTQFFPSSEKFGLTLQMKRAAISIVSNLAEGSARHSSKDQAHFTLIAYSSTIELLNQLIIANDLNFLNTQYLSEGRNMIEKLTGRIAALRNSQLNPKL